MILKSLLTWWYGPGWQQIRLSTAARTKAISDSFSVPSLLKTLFAPWRRIYTDGGSGVGGQLQALEDNFVSRLVGFGVRSTVLIAAGTVVLGLRLLALAQILLWPLVPPLIVLCFLLGFLGFIPRAG